MEIVEKAKLAKEAIRTWQRVKSSLRNKVLEEMALILINNKDEILSANRIDLQNAQDKGISGALLDRLALTDDRIMDMAQGMREVASMPDPLGEVLHGMVRPNGLQINKVRVPLGVIGIIYEARPNVTADATGLCLKAGNAVILRGGSEAVRSNQRIVALLRQALVNVELSPEIVQIVEDTDRAQVQQMMKLNQYIDVIIPRGGAGLIQAVINHSTVPVIETGVGNCHIFVDESANLADACAITINAKTQRPAVCNAAETLLVHSDVADEFLPQVYEALKAKGVLVRGCTQVKQILPDVELASESDWETEYLDLTLAVRVIKTFDDGLDHIARYGTRHSEAIVTESYTHAQRFLAEVDAAAVYVNASTRFTDGSQFGMGAEIGISTQKLHARGPMGLNELTTTKYIVYGKGTTRA